MQLSGTVGEGVGNEPVPHASYGSPCFMFQWQIARLENGSETAQNHLSWAFREMLNVPGQCAALSTVMATTVAPIAQSLLSSELELLSSHAKTKGTELLALQRQCGGTNGRRCGCRMCPSCGMCSGSFGNSTSSSLSN